MSKVYKNNLRLNSSSQGNERRREISKNILKNSTPLPQTLLYRDIDEEFKNWVEEELRVSFEGETIPTIALYSNQRFSEYMQSWNNVDDKKNLILNFKIITRENNPKSGTIVGQTKNIPGEHTTLLKTVEARDKNNRKYYIDYRLKQPLTVDLIYTISLLTNKYELLNEFNMLVNDKFKSITAYIQPNGHFIPMKLNDISDESEYSIDNRQYYSQSYNITVMAYIITENDFIVEERPELKFVGYEGDKSTYADIEELPPCLSDNTDYQYIPINLTINVGKCKNSYKFTIDSDFQLESIETENIRSFKLFVNDIERILDNTLKIKENDLVHVKRIIKYKSFDESKILLKGFKYTEAFKKDENIVINNIVIN